MTTRRRAIHQRRAASIASRTARNNCIVAFRCAVKARDRLP
jgi:hypothetical protein